jgi:hypothetical protein
VELQIHQRLKTENKANQDHYGKCKNSKQNTQYKIGYKQLAVEEGFQTQRVRFKVLVLISEDEYTIKKTAFDDGEFDKVAPSRCDNFWDVLHSEDRGRGDGVYS